MQTETFKTGDLVSASLGYGNLTLGTYVKPDDQKKGNHFLKLDGIMCLQSISDKKFTSYVKDYIAFTKDDLKTGMYVKTKRGEVFQVLLDTQHGDLLVSKNKTLPLSKYTLFLEATGDVENTIQVIYQPTRLMDYLDTSKSMLMTWEREREREPMTLSQIEAELGKRIRLIEE